MYLANVKSIFIFLFLLAMVHPGRIREKEGDVVSYVELFDASR